MNIIFIFLAIIIGLILLAFKDLRRVVFILIMGIFAVRAGLSNEGWNWDFFEILGVILIAVSAGIGITMLLELFD